MTTSILVCLLFLQPLVILGQYSIPPVEFAVTPTEMTAWIPDASGVKFFAFHARINQRLGTGEPGEISGETRIPTNGRWAVRKGDLDLKVGDKIYYWVFVQHEGYGYRKDGEVYEITDFSKGQECVRSQTTVDGNAVCAGTVIFEDDFAENQIDISKWKVDHLIPVTGPNYEFNSYQNNDTVVRVSSGKLTIRPIAHTEEQDIRGILDVRQGCTGSDNQCYQEQRYHQILQPVVSGRIHSTKQFQYGRIEIKAKLPSGDWIYPQVKLTTADSSPEIWIAYARGNRVLRGNDGDDLGATLLFGGLVLDQEEPRRSQLLRSHRSDFPFTDSVHNYSVVWRPSGLTFFVDSVQYGEVKSSEYGNNILTREMKITLGVGVGGNNDFPDTYVTGSGNTKPWNNMEVKEKRNFFDARDQWLPTWGERARLEVDEVKVYAL